jgi:hypothetical protein
MIVGPFNGAAAREQTLPMSFYATSINLSGLIQRAYELEIYQFVYAP